MATTSSAGVSDTASASSSVTVDILVDERRELQRVAGALVAHVPTRETAGLRVDERNEPIERGSVVARAPRQQQRRHLR
jgi:hypothetical protein